MQKCPWLRLHRLQGLTLLELMVVVALIGILSAIALPNYAQYVLRSHRADARSALLQAAHWMERAATATGAYPLAEQFPQSLQAIPSGRYRIGIESPLEGDADGVSYRLTATRQNAQSNDACGDFTLDHTGVQGVTGALGKEQCWGR